MARHDLPGLLGQSLCGPPVLASGHHRVLVDHHRLGLALGLGVSLDILQRLVRRLVGLV